MLSRPIFYLAAGSNKWGIGHLLRSIELMNVLRERQISICSVALIPDRVNAQRDLAFVGAYDQCRQSLGEVTCADAKGVVVDVHTDLQPELLPWLKEQKLPVVALDWYHKSGNVVTTKVNLRGEASALKHCIIRREFHCAQANNCMQIPKYDAAVVMGGRDNRGYLSKIYRLFAGDKRFSNKKIVVVLGPLAEGKLEKLPGQPAARISILKTPDKVADIMTKAMVGITNGGTSLMEFTMLGIPSLIFPQSEQEDSFVKPFLEEGCGILGSLDPGTFAEQIIELWENMSLRNVMSEKAVGLIDGRGVDRVADIIVRTIVTRN